MSCSEHILAPRGGYLLGEHSLTELQGGARGQVGGARGWAGCLRSAQMVPSHEAQQVLWPQKHFFPFKIRRNID